MSENGNTTMTKVPTVTMPPIDHELFAALRPRKQIVPVGDDMELLVREMVLEQWEKFFTQIGRALDVGKFIKPLIEALQQAAPGDSTMSGTTFMSVIASHSESIGEMIEVVITEILAKDLPLLVKISLDNRENYKILYEKLGDSLAAYGDAEDKSSQVVGYICTEVTGRQSGHVLQIALEANDFKDVLGKIWSALGKAAGLTGVIEPQPEVEPEATH